MAELIPIDEIDSLIKKYKSLKNVELEVSFKKLDVLAWDRINDKLVDIVDRKNIKGTDSLDVLIELSNQRTLRYSIRDTDVISKLSSQRHNQVHGFLLSLKESKDIDIEIKDRGAATRVQFPEINASAKLISETKTKERQTGAERLLFRYKNRYSFVHKNIRFDTTKVRQSNRLETLNDAWYQYEAEVEVIDPKVTSKELIDGMIVIVQAIQDSDLVIGVTESKQVLDYYYQILNTSGRIISRNVISMEIRHLGFIPNNYVVTEKADGERYLMIVKDNTPYLMSTNTIVRKTGLKLADNSLDKTIMDGELIGDNYYVFDLIYDGTDYRSSNHPITHRINRITEIMKHFQIVPFRDYASTKQDFNLSSIITFYTKELEKYWTKIKELQKKTKGLLVTRKLYLIPYGISESEVFAYGDLLWRTSLKGILPHSIDGIIYTPINAPYLIQARASELDTIPLDYKWKPPSHNSIDFYITYDQADTGDAIYVINGSEYKNANLHVGQERKSGETPVPFLVNGVPQTAFIKIVNGMARDSEGTVLPDKSVVEFTYDNNTIADGFKWIAYKYRPDKTESVKRYRRKYGNNTVIASRIWRSINEPLTEQIIATLANPSTFAVEMKRLIEPKSYYQKAVSTAIGMRAFHNWIKQNLIKLYASGSVLDIGCGRGGDLQKFVRARVDLYVGVDIDYHSMYTIPGSAVERYHKMKHIAPPMHFIQADARLAFDPTIQSKALQYADPQMIKEWLSKKYNTINAQFTLHYYLQSADSWDNFCQNLNQTMDNDAYLLITAFDGKLIFDKLKNKDKITITYDKYGSRLVLCEIVKTYNSSDSKRVGLGIDVHNSLINDPGQYVKEYLVDPDFLIDSLRNKCGLKLVETESFYDIWQLYDGSFKGENKQIRDVQAFYKQIKDDDPETMASFKMSMLNRYYVFKKIGFGNQPSRVVGFNRELSSCRVLAPWFANMNLKLDDRMASNNINQLYRHVKTKYEHKPAVYLVKHTVKDDTDTFRMTKVKGGSPTCIVYREPNGTFYPLHYKGNHMISSEQAISDLEKMVQISSLE